MDIALNLFYLVAGFVLLIKGADWFVEGTSGIAAKLGIPCYDHEIIDRLEEESGFAREYIAE